MFKQQLKKQTTQQIIVLLIGVASALVICLSLLRHFGDMSHDVCRELSATFCLAFSGETENTSSRLNSSKYV